MVNKIIDGTVKVMLAPAFGLKPKGRDQRSNERSNGNTRNKRERSKSRDDKGKSRSDKEASSSFFFTLVHSPRTLFKLECSSSCATAIILPRQELLKQDEIAAHSKKTKETFTFLLGEASGLKSNVSSLSQ
jgi:hypothetical protein